MKRFRSSATVSVILSVLALTACAGTDGTTGTEAGAPRPTAAAPASSAASAPAAAGDSADAKLCNQVNVAGDAWKKAWIDAFRTGQDADPAAAALKKALEDFARAVTAAAGTADSKAAVAAKEMAAQSTKAAAAPDPSEAFTANTAFDTAMDELATACKAAGVTIPV